jgi:hypothetical protein
VVRGAVEVAAVVRVMLAHLPPFWRLDPGQLDGLAGKVVLTPQGQRAGVVERAWLRGQDVWMDVLLDRPRLPHELDLARLSGPLSISRVKQ